MIIDHEIDWDKYDNLCNSSHLTKDSGKVSDATGLLIKGYLPGASVGSVCEIEPLGTEKKISAEVVGFQDRNVLMMPLQEIRGINLGAKINLLRTTASIKVGEQLLGRVINGLGEPIDEKEHLSATIEFPLYADVVNPLQRKPIDEPLDLGIKAINGVLTIGKGQRAAIMAGSGVGKSVLLGMMARYTEADINVIALIGERGREVREFIENDLGEEGLKKSVIVAVTSDQSALLRMRGAFVATAIAEYFSSMGKNVLLMMDSVTRFSMAQREIGLSVGEPPTTKGYTPSVFATLPKLLERAGSFVGKGNITGLYTVLVEGSDMEDPIADTVRSIVDGHIVLLRELAQKGHFPAIDILQSTSRVMRAITRSDHQALAQRLRENLAIYKDAEDLINIGAYKSGSNPKIDKAIKLIDPINEFLKQKVQDQTDFKNTLKTLHQIMMNS